MDPIERELDRLRQASPLAADALAPDLVHLLPRGGGEATRLTDLPRGVRQ